jgi:hypothetical protein
MTSATRLSRVLSLVRQARASAARAASTRLSMLVARRPQVFDDGGYRYLGELKGNKGSRNYLIPRSANLADYRSVSVWCDRFNVSFGADTLVRG